MFADVAVGDERIKKTHEERLMTAIQRLYTLVRGKRLAEAETAVTDALYKASQAISAVGGFLCVCALIWVFQTSALGVSNPRVD